MDYIGPYSFAQSVVTWTLIGSETAHSLQGMTSSSGSIKNPRNFLKCSSNETKNTCFPNDCDIFADNTQRKGKTIKITETGTTPLGIVTNVFFIESYFKTDIMKNPELIPMKWLSKDRIDNASLIFTKEDELSKIFNEFRFNFTIQLNKNISTSLQKFNFVDDVEKSIDLDPSKFICPSCLNVNEKANKVRNFCDFVLDILLSRKALYGHISSFYPENPPEIKLREIIGVNPNSYETIKTALENLRE